MTDIFKRHYDSLPKLLTLPHIVVKRPKEIVYAKR